MTTKFQHINTGFFFGQAYKSNVSVLKLITMLELVTFPIPPLN